MGLDYATYVALEVGFPLAIPFAFLLGSTLFMIVLVFLKYRIPSLQGLYRSMYSSLLRFLGLFYEGQLLEEMENGSCSLLFALIITSIPVSFVALAFSNAFLFRVVFGCVPGFDCFSRENGTFGKPINCSYHEEMEDVTAVICYQFALDSFKGIVAFGGSVLFLWVVCKCVRQENNRCSLCFVVLFFILYCGEVLVWIRMWTLTYKPFTAKSVLTLLVQLFTLFWLLILSYKQMDPSQLGRPKESGGTMVGISPQGSGASASTSTERQPLLSTSNL